VGLGANPHDAFRFRSIWLPIANAPNHWSHQTGNPRYITVSLRTVEIVEGLPELNGQRCGDVCLVRYYPGNKKRNIRHQEKSC
jgi:hypothetical protein